MASDEELDDIDDCLETLRPITSLRWSDRHLPDDRDHLDQRILERYLSESDDWRREFEQKLGREEADALGAFAGRAASLAVRLRNQHYLELGILALALFAASGSDWRDALVEVPIHYRSAQLLGLDPAEVFRSSVRLGGDSVQVWGETFRRRAPEFALDGKWRESQDDQGFIWAPA